MTYCPNCGAWINDAPRVKCHLDGTYCLAAACNELYCSKLRDQEQKEEEDKDEPTDLG